METSSFGNVRFFAISLIFYLAVTVSYILYAVLKKEEVGKVATRLLVIDLLGHAVALILKTLEAKHAPFVTTYESLSFLAWLIALVYLLLQFRLRIGVLGALLTLLAFLAITAASLLLPQYKRVGPLVLALQSYWLEFHIVTCFIGYVCFAVSFAAGIAYLVRRSDEPKSSLSKDNLDMIGYKSISVSFLFLTPGIIWGRSWLMRHGVHIGDGTAKRCGL